MIFTIIYRYFPFWLRSDEIHTLHEDKHIFMITSTETHCVLCEVKQEAKAQIEYLNVKAKHNQFKLIPDDVNLLVRYR